MAFVTCALATDSMVIVVVKALEDACQKWAGGK
jgi:hypothetical protein